jgi:signal transduction histidine kinase/putative methionine-R-sulfoxide reductase with GAF domain
MTLASGVTQGLGATPGLDGAGEGPAEFRSLAQVKMLQSLTRTLNQLHDVDEIAGAITAELGTLIDYHNCRVHLLDEEHGELVPASFRGRLTEYQGETYEALTLRVGEGITGRVAETGVSVYTPDADRCEFAVTIPGTPEVDESIVCAPLLYGDRVVGTVTISKLGIDQFDEEDVRVLEVLASHAAVAIENARLLEAERSAAATSEALLLLSRALTEAHDVDSVLSVALATIPALIPCSNVSAYLRDTVPGVFRMVAGQNLPRVAESESGGTIVPPEVAETFLRSLEAPFVIDRDMQVLLPDWLRLREPADVLVAPMRWDPDGLGALVVLAPDPSSHFDRSALDLAKGIADIASLAMGTASRFTELEEATRRLQELDDMKNTFLQAVSHDLRTPLAAILGLAITLDREEVGLRLDERRELTSRLAANARKLDRILSNLLDLERLLRGVVEPRRTPTDVAALVRRVVAEADFLAGRTVHSDLARVTVALDAPKVERIIENLLVNTSKHTPTHSPIWVRVEPAEGGVLIVVEDAGPGVPEAFRDAVFEPFRQGPGEHPSPGAGIGLSLVARFAELHRGRAWVEDRAGGGASFRVFLPDGVPAAA